MVQNKKWNLFIGIALSSGFLSIPTAFAHEDRNNPCKPISDACEAAGYDHDTQDKNVWENCVIPIVKGETISDVDVTDQQIAQCNSFKNAKRAWEKNWMKNHPSAGSSPSGTSTGGTTGSSTTGGSTD